MKGAKISQCDLAISEAARILLAFLLRLSNEDGHPDLRQRPLRVRKRYAVLLYSGELAAELFYCKGQFETDFRPKVIVPILLTRDEADHAKLREAAWRLVVKHRESILALALELTRVKKMTNKRLVGFLRNRLAAA